MGRGVRKNGSSRGTDVKMDQLPLFAQDDLDTEKERYIPQAGIQKRNRRPSSPFSSKSKITAR